jgi:hypothetical protein
MKSIIMLVGLFLGCHAASAAVDTTLNAYTGKYVFPAGSPTPEAIVSLENGTMTISSSIGSSTLSRIEGDVFSIVDYNGTAEFKRDEAGAVISVRVVVQDIDMVGTKQRIAAIIKPILPFRY